MSDGVGGDFVCVLVVFCDLASQWAASLDWFLGQELECTHVPIPFVSLPCDKKCCSRATNPLRVCKTITIYLQITRGHKFSLLMVDMML